MLITSAQPSEEFFKAVVSQIREMLSDTKLRCGYFLPYGVSKYANN